MPKAALSSGAGGGASMHSVSLVRAAVLCSMRDSSAPCTLLLFFGRCRRRFFFCQGGACPNGGSRAWLRALCWAEHIFRAPLVRIPAQRYSCKVEAEHPHPCSSCRSIQEAHGLKELAFSLVGFFSCLATFCFQNLLSFVSVRSSFILKKSFRKIHCV
uniref:Uncharacterized protein n=1 Tax=Ixodes ricinus TaxID=34613 RepID=A0A6B0UWV1_IXORI